MGFDYDTPPDPGPSPEYQVIGLDPIKQAPQVFLYLKWEPNGYDGYLPDGISFESRYFDTPQLWIDAYSKNDPRALRELQEGIDAIFEPPIPRMINPNDN